MEKINILIIISLCVLLSVGGLYIFVNKTKCKCTNNHGSQPKGILSGSSPKDNKYILYEINYPRILGCPFDVNTSGVTKFSVGGSQYTLDLPNNTLILGEKSYPVESSGNTYVFKDEHGKSYIISTINAWKGQLRVNLLDC